MTLSFATLPFSSTFSMPKNFCRALISAGSASAAPAAKVDRTHRTPGKNADRNRMHFMVRAPLRSVSRMQAPVPVPLAHGNSNRVFILVLKCLRDCCGAPDDATGVGSESGPEWEARVAQKKVFVCALMLLPSSVSTYSLRTTLTYLFCC